MPDNDLVQRLSSGLHPVAVSLGPERTLKALKECLDRDFVHIRFTNTRVTPSLGCRSIVNAASGDATLVSHEAS